VNALECLLISATSTGSEMMYRDAPNKVKRKGDLELFDCLLEYESDTLL
jgi:hypothetical protein